MSETQTSRRRGSSLYPAPSENIKKMVASLGATKTAEEVGVSPSHIHDIMNGNSKCSRTIDRAAEGCLRRMGKANELVKQCVVARIVLAHWVTIKAVIVSLGGHVFEEIAALEVDIKTDLLLVVFSLNSQHVQSVSHLIAVTGGKSKTVA